jgi:diguanylate cyclase (GGDEF)-like protein
VEELQDRTPVQRVADGTADHIPARFFDLAGDLLAVLEPGGQITTVNTTLAALIGCDVDSLIGTPITDLLVPVDPAAFSAANSTLTSTNASAQLELTHRRGNVQATVIATLHLDEVSGQRLFVARDVSEQRRLNAQLESRGRKDELASLSNRTGFADAVELELKMGQSIAVIAVILDDIAGISQQYGEAIANELVHAAFSRMRRNLRGTDTMARLGTGEFAIMLTGDSVHRSGERMAAQIAETLRRSFGVKGNRIEVLCSVGVSVGKPLTHSHDVLISNALSAASDARKTGTTCAVVFGTDGVATLTTDSRPADAVQAALDQPDQLSTQVQGIFSADGRGAMGVEVRLIQDLGGMRRLSDSGGDNVIEAITPEAVEETLGTIGPWFLGHPSRRMCLNIAEAYLDSTELFDRLSELAKTAGLNPAQIVCEVSDEALTSGSNPERLTSEIRRHGFQLSIDNFGMGSASLGHLRDLDVNYVKIDPLVTENLFASEYHSAVIRSVVEVARATAISVIANGVSTKEQLNAVRAMGCSFVQGTGVHTSESLQAFASRVG